MEKIIYTAGFFDGEGYIGYGFRGRIEIRIVNTNKEVLEKLMEWWGGNIYTRKPQKNRKTAYDWVLLERKRVEKFIELIYPHVIVKKNNIKEIIVIQ